MDVQPNSEACRGWSCFSHKFAPEIVKAAALPWAAAADCERVQRLAGGTAKRMMYYPSQNSIGAAWGIIERGFKASWARIRPGAKYPPLRRFCPPCPEPGAERL